MVADWLRTLEERLAAGGEDELAVALVSLAYIAGADIDIPADERRGAGRRAVLLLATGGDPARGLDLDGRAVRAIARDLAAPERAAALTGGLARLVPEAVGLAHVNAALRALRDDADVAWRAYAASVLADELDDDAGEGPES
jgi:hypothetical protein